MIAALVLAAGASKRMGKPKQIVRIRGVPMLQAVLDALHRSKVDSVVVVLGANAEEVRGLVEFGDDRVLVNPAFAEGMSSSIRLGVEEVEGWAEAALIVLGDQPLVRAGTIDRLVSAYEASKAPIVVPVSAGRWGNPVLFDKALFPEIKELRGDVGARSIVERNRERVMEVPVRDRGVLLDIDTPSDHAAASGRIRGSYRLRGRA